MIVDARALPADTTIAGDVCVIGAGPAGLTVARELATARVILLESGGLYPSPEVQELARGEIAGESYWSLDTARLRCLGGTSAHWTGWCRPLDELDFAARPWVPESGWPISREELLPYYGKAQGSCDLGALDYDAASWSERLRAPLLPLDPTLARTSVFQMSTPTRFGEKWLEALRSSNRIEAFLQATAVELETERRDSRIGRLTAVSASGGRFRVRAKAFVLAGGGIENCRLLLTSGSPRGLANRHGLVGRFFLEHPHTAVGVLHASSADQLRLYQPGCDVEGGHPRAVRATIVLPAELQAREQLLGCSIGIDPLPRPLPYGADEVTATRTLARRLQGLDVQSGYELLARAEQQPSADSYVRLGSSRDALGVPRVALVWRHHEKTLHSIRRTLEIAALALARAGVGRVYSYVHGEHRPAGVWPEIFGGYHHMGTTRMHDDPQRGVVDRDCRVHSLENLYVAGSSVFPTGGYTNPTLTLVALASRLAETINRRL